MSDRKWVVSGDKTTALDTTALDKPGDLSLNNEQR
jgi:hypothetical protein